MHNRVLKVVKLEMRLGEDTASLRDRNVAGVNTVLHYHSRDTRTPCKRIGAKLKEVLYFLGVLGRNDQPLVVIVRVLRVREFAKEFGTFGRRRIHVDGVLVGDLEVWHCCRSRGCS